MKFKQEVLKYKVWCLKNGYSYKKELALLWYFDQTGRTTGKHKGYQVRLRKGGKTYNLSEIKDYFIK